MAKTKEIEGKNGGIVYLPINELFPHPDNPRKDLGDLTELAESIKTKGVLQNLTVVPWFSEITRQPAENGKHVGYRIVIGHRRCAAAKLAGLTELPCMIADMTPTEQIGTMLLENIQRNDLTVKEQADSFQMMLNLGESVDTVSEKTGFSKSTVRRRLKLCELDEKKFAAACKRQVTLEDFDRLSKIKDVEKRNALLDEIGTKNFEYQYTNAVNEQTREEKKKELREYLISVGMKEIEEFDYKKHRYFKTTPTDLKKTKAEWGEGSGKGKWFRLAYNGASADIYITQSVHKETAEEKQKREREEKRREKESLLKSEAKTMFEMRRAFVEKCSGSIVKNHAADLADYLVKFLFSQSSLYMRFNRHVYAQLVGENIKSGESAEYIRIKDATRHQTEYSLLAVIYALVGDSESEKCYDYNNRYKRNEKLEALYELLVKLGYEMSDTEKEMLSGVSGLYEKDEENEDEENDDLDDDENYDDDVEE